VHLCAAQNAISGWKKRGALRLISIVSGMQQGRRGLWIRAWTPEQLAMSRGIPVPDTTGERVLVGSSPGPVTVGPVLPYEEALARVSSLGAMCDALMRAR
jgi:hypothetical protein